MRPLEPVAFHFIDEADDCGVEAFEMRRRSDALIQVFLSADRPETKLTPERILQ